MEATQAPPSVAQLPVTVALRKKLEPRLSPEHLSLVDRALAYSEEAHRGQSRASGQPYIIHPIAVADVLADWKMDHQSVIAALLHDLIEDTSVTFETIRENFGNSVAELVEGVSKIEKLEEQKLEERQAENLRKILLAISKDWRVIFIKLGDRLHNIRTLAHIRDQNKRKRIARETLEIYAPISDRLGMSNVCRELETLAFRHLHPYRYRVLNKALKKSGTQHRKAIESVQKLICEQMERHDIQARLSGREKNLYSVYRKMVEKRLSFSDVEDIVGIRVIVGGRLECYTALGVLHMCFQPIPTKFDDYIAVPKSNGYQSLHTTVKDKSGMTLELQIRSEQMHAFAEQGLAAHWLYKRGEQYMSQRVQTAADMRLQSLMKLQAEADDDAEYLKNVKIDLYPGEIYVVSPKGKIIPMPKDSTALDFAYQIHSDLGHRAAFARINGKPMPLSARLDNGQVVDIVTGERSTPLPHWLHFVTTPRARSQIRHRLKLAQANQVEQLGKQLLTSSFNKMGIDPKAVSEDQWKAHFAGKAYGTHAELHREIGLGKTASDLVVYELLSAKGRKKRPARGQSPAIPVSGAGASAVKIAACCQPLPNEPIVGLMQKGLGLVVHFHACRELLDSKENAVWIEVSWDSEATKRRHLAPISVQCVNRPGITSRVFSVIADSQINIEGFSMQGGRIENEHVTMSIQIEVNSALECEQLINRLRMETGVVDAKRVRGKSEAPPAS